MAADLKLPSFDFEGLLSLHRKNIEALVAANQLVLEGWQAAGRRYAETAQQSLTEVATLTKELLATGSTQDKVTRQADLVKKTFERTSANTKELLALVTKSQSEAAEIISRRIGDSLDELKKTATTTSGKADKGDVRTK